MNSKLKKGLIISGAIALVVLPLGGLAFAGYSYSWGPFGGLGGIRMSMLKGNAEQYDMENLEKEENPLLTGKKALFLGSSVTYGYASMQQSLGEYFEYKYGVIKTKEAVSGTTLVDDSTDSYVSRLKNNVGENADFDFAVIQLSTNDASKNKPLGEIAASDYDVHTITGAIEYIISYCKTNYDCPVVFYTGSRYDSTAYKAMVDRLYEIKDKWGIGVLDLYTSDEFNSITDEQRSLYMSDNIHPTRAGYSSWWCPELAKQLLEYLKD